MEFYCKLCNKYTTAELEFTSTFRSNITVKCLFCGILLGKPQNVNNTWHNFSNDSVMLFECYEQGDEEYFNCETDLDEHKGLKSTFRTIINFNSADFGK